MTTENVFFFLVVLRFPPFQTLENTEIISQNVFFCKHKQSVRNKIDYYQCQVYHTYRGAERASIYTQVKCVVVLGTDLSTPFISFTQTIPITLNWFFQIQCALSPLLSHQSCLLQHHFIYPLLRGS